MVQAWRVHELGTPDRLVLDEVEAPVPGPGEVAIDVRAAALNFPDVLLVRGEYQVRPERPFAPGTEVSGVVTGLGPGVTDFEIGDRVFAIPKFGVGGFIGRTVANRTVTFRVPDAMTFTTAAAFHVVYQTGHLALHRRAQLRAGETLLVHAGAGGVGTAAIQLGKAAGARVIATAGGEAKRTRCLALGADAAIDYTTDDFVTRVNDLTDSNGADVIFDPVGGDVFDRSRKCIAFEGRLLVIGFTSGHIPQAPTNHALVKNYSIVGVNWGFYMTKAPEVIHATHRALMDLYGQGLIDPIVSEVIPFAEIPAALARLAHRETTGKIVAEL